MAKRCKHTTEIADIRISEKGWVQVSQLQHSAGNQGGKMIPIEIRSKADCVDLDIKHFAERRMSFALDRFRNLRRVVLSFEDVNGPRGGADKLCRIVAEFGFVTVVVEEVQRTWESAVARGMRRVARKVARVLERVNRLASHTAHRTPTKAARMHGEAQEIPC